MSKKFKDLEVLREGNFVDANGNEVSITQTDLAELAETFDANLWRSPYVKGHPKDNDPAQGYPDSFYVKGKKLFMKTAKLFADFKEDLKAGKFSKISLSIFNRNSPANPTPGKLYVRHVGFLGAVPPAVSGLANVELSGTKGDFFEIELSYKERSVNRILAGLRDFIIEKFTLEDADRFIPSYEVQSIIEEQAREDVENTPHQFSEPKSTNEEPPMPDDNALSHEEQIEQLKTDLSAAESKNSTLEASLAKHTGAARKAGIISFCDQMVSEGKLAPAMKDKWVQLMESLPETEVELSEGKTTPLEMAQDLIQHQAKILDFSEKSKPDGEPKPPVNFAAPAGQDVDQDGLDSLAKAKAYAQKHNVSLSEAAKAVGA